MTHEFHLVRAELRIFQSPSKGKWDNNEESRDIIISILQKKEQNLQVISSINSTTTFKGWLEFNITSALIKFLDQHEGQMSQMELIVKTANTATEIIVEDLMGEYKPFITGYFNGPELISRMKHLRFKRNVETPNVKSNSYRPNTKIEQPKTCQRMNFTIDFEELQMHDWVIAPKKFDAYYCGGECHFPLASAMNATNHAIVQTLMHLQLPDLPKPGCVPTNFGSISILRHVDDETVNLSTYKNAVAKSCGCH